MNLVLLATTYFTDDAEGWARMENAVDCITHNYKMLYEHTGPLKVLIADDASSAEMRLLFAARIHAFVNTLTANKQSDFQLVGRNEPHGVGGSINHALFWGMGNSIVLYMVDDWKIYRPLDVGPWMRALELNESICSVRLGPPHPHTRGVIEAIGSDWNNWAIRLEQQGFAFGHRPALWHRRMFDNHGWFKENCNAFECEADYADRVNITYPHGRCIVQAIDNPFHHEFVNELADVERAWGVETP